RDLDYLQSFLQISYSRFLTHTRSSELIESKAKVILSLYTSTLTPNVSKKPSYLLALALHFNFDYLAPPNETPRTSPNRHLAALTNILKSSSNPKAARLSGLAFNLLARLAPLVTTTALLPTSNSEPVDFKRLNRSVSWIRAVWESGTDGLACAVFGKLEITMPVVDWTHFFEACEPRDGTELVVGQVTGGARSMVELFVHWLGKVTEGSGETWEWALIARKAVGELVKLAGIGGPIVVAQSKVVGILRGLCEMLFEEEVNEEKKELQKMFLENLVASLLAPASADDQTPESVQFFRLDILKLLYSLYENFPSSSSQPIHGLITTITPALCSDPSILTIYLNSIQSGGWSVKSVRALAAIIHTAQSNNSWPWVTEALADFAGIQNVTSGVAVEFATMALVRKVVETIIIETEVMSVMIDEVRSLVGVASGGGGWVVRVLDLMVVAVAKSETSLEGIERLWESVLPVVVNITLGGGICSDGSGWEIVLKESIGGLNPVENSAQIIKRILQLFLRTGVKIRESEAFEASVNVLQKMKELLLFARMDQEVAPS
ncbi:hypothetical protein HK096_008220, partial [Nowakowskiella sp. JEL0078]